MIFPAEDGYLATHNVRIAGKLALPESVTKQHARMCAQLGGIGRRINATQEGMDTEALKEIAGNHIDRARTARP